MARVLEGLQPEKVFYYFEEISRIPRGSNHEKEISDFLLDWAKKKRLEAEQDEFMNILIRKPGSKGYENAPAVILQAHMDMVCEKNMDVVHDFMKDPLKLRIDGDYIYATGTTLGADNGVGVAYVMALLDSDNISHPPLEVLITTDEEAGMTGAKGFDIKRLKGGTLINLDDEDEGKFTAGSAGGATIKLSIPVLTTAPEYDSFYKVAIKGLKGGHSGADIDKERGNSIKLMGRLLYDLKDYIELADISGGSKSNAIPRECQVTMSVREGTDIMEHINKWRAVFKNEFAFSDPNIVIEIEKTGKTPKVYDEKIKSSLISAINLIPDGPMRNSPELGMVVYSNNLGVLSSNDGMIILTCAPRSSTESMLNQFIDTARLISEVLGIGLEVSSSYPGWDYKRESRIRELCLETYESMYGKKGEVRIVHAGLECGLFIEKRPELDVISTGPDTFDVHTPDEHLSISSTRRTFDFLCKLLEKMK